MRCLKYIGGSKSYLAFHGDRSYELKQHVEYDLPDTLAMRLLRLGDFVESTNPSGFDPKRIKGKYQKCFIIGSGKSVDALDLSKLDGHFTIAINFMYRVYYKTKSVFFIDKDVIERNGGAAVPELLAYNGLIFCSMRSGYDVIDKRKNVIPFSLNGTEPSMNINDGLFGKLLSGMSALNLALILGYDKIYLLGFDGYVQAQQRVNNYGGANKYYDAEWWGKRFAGFKKFEPWKSRIYNCNPKSALKEFQYISYEEAVNGG